MQNTQLYKDYSYYLKIERSLSPNTVKGYCSDIEHFLEDSGKGAADVTSDDIASYLGEKSASLTKRSQARLISALRSFYDWMILEGQVKENPCDRIDPPKIERHLPEVLSVEEVEAIIDSADLGTSIGVRDRAILEVLYGCGLRVSEVCTLKLSDIYMDESFIRVIGKGDKERFVPVGDMAVEALEAYFEVRNEPARGYEDNVFLNRFGKPLSRVSVFNMIKTRAMLAGIRKEISPHTFRHSFATHLIENGADLRVVQEMLGHENILTTEIYTHIDTSTWQGSIIAHHPRCKKK